MKMVDWMNFKEELEQKTKTIEEILQRSLPAEEGYRCRVAEAMNYSTASHDDGGECGTVL